jgi:hypothetical protein
MGRLTVAIPEFTCVSAAKVNLLSYMYHNAYIFETLCECTFRVMISVGKVDK